MLRPNTETIEDAVMALVAEGGGVAAVIPANEPETFPAPAGPYATVLLINEIERGDPYSQRTRNDDDSLTITTVRTARGRYSVQWYRTGAQDAARRFAIWVRSPGGTQWMLERNLTLNRVSDIRRLDAVALDVSAGDEWEERAGVDLDLGYLVTLEETADAIATVGINVHVDDYAREEIPA